MASAIERRHSIGIHPLHAVLLAGAISLFLGAALSDAAYASTYEIQWNNFASWLTAGALVFAGLALLFAIIELLPTDRRPRGSGMYVVLLLITWVAGFWSALVHARDAWAGMPTGLVLSVIVTALACIAMGIGITLPRTGARR